MTSVSMRMMLFINISAIILLWIEYVNTKSCGAGCKGCRTYGCYNCKKQYYSYVEDGIFICKLCPDLCKTCQFDRRTFGISCISCKDEHYLDYYNNTYYCSKCHDGCAQCTARNWCSECKDGWWGQSCLYSCNTCNDCIEKTCKERCKHIENQDARRLCKHENSNCHHKCSRGFSGSTKSHIHTSSPSIGTTTSKTRRPSTNKSQLPLTTATPALYIGIAVVGLLVVAAVIVVIVCIKRRKRRQYQESSPQETNNEEIIYAKQNKVITMSNQESQSIGLDLQRPNKDRLSISASEQSNRSCNNVQSHVTGRVLDIDDIILETCLDESEIVVTEANAITEKTKDDDTYYNVLSFQRNQSKVDKFEEYVKTKSTFDFYTEFQKFPKGLSRPYTHAKKPDNKVKCRYNGVYPYDTNRVKLLGNDNDNDFINASYIDGYTRQKEYIASLGPTKETMADFVDFWAMIWQDKVEKIVMLTKLVEETKMKCEQYWPDITKTISYGDVIVTCTSEDSNTDYTLRTLSVKKGETTRLVYQTHFLSWPDKRVPERTDVLLTLIDKVRAVKSEMDGLVVVHCSAGVGRTGTYIALDILLQQLTEEGAVDVYGCVIGIRGQRVAMVQTLEQYEFIHNVLVERIRKTKSKI